MKKIISVILTFAIFTSCIPTFAADEDNYVVSDLPWEAEDIGTDEATEPVQINDIPADVQDSEEEPPVYEPIVHEEIITEDLVFPEGSENLMPDESPNPWEISMFSTSDDQSSVWKSLYAEQFGDDYLKSYAKKEDGQRVTGNTNRLVIEETDLTLPGKNGLDLVIKRKYDNQDYNESYSYYKSVDADGRPEDMYLYQNRYIYAFTKNSRKTIYIGFLTESQIYTYMDETIYVDSTKLERKRQYTANGLSFYNFEDIWSCMSEDGDIQLEYDNSIDMEFANVKYKNDTTIYDLESRKIFGENNSLAYNWRFLLPEAYLYGYSYSTDKTKTYKKYYREYVGAFRDIDGNVYTLTGKDTFTKYYNNDTTKYTSSYTPDDNNYLRFEAMYAPATLYENGPEYNFVVYDNRGRTYYLYDTGLKVEERPARRHSMYIVAVKDEYDNMIRYEYVSGEKSSMLHRINKIIDTYGREINFSYNSGTVEISYTDEKENKRRITYEKTDLPASALPADSPLAQKDGVRLTVTNAEGEVTHYDARDADVMNYYSMGNEDINANPNPGDNFVYTSDGYNIERIIYPTGAETRYRYKCLYPANKVTRVCRGVYAVDESHDIVNTNEENLKEYSFDNTGMSIETTCNETSKDKKTVTKYNADGLSETVKITSETDSKPYKNITYEYDRHNNPETITINENGIKTVNSYSYTTGYPNMLKSESNGLMSVSYNYHKVNNEYSDKIQQITYRKMSGSKYVDDYSVITELTPDNKSIEYEKTVKDGVIKAQKKYEYDNEGNITAVKQWTNDTNGNGVLDENDDIVTLSTDYSITEQKSLNTINTSSDIINADGENEGAVSMAYKYNIYGSPISQTDSYGTETTVEYDAINRPIKYNLPNGGTRTIQYNTEQNSASITDEANINTEYRYDGLGRITEKFVSGNKIESYTYDSSGRLSTKSLYRDRNKGTREYYTYDILDRVVKKDVYSLPLKLLYSEKYKYSHVNDNEYSVEKTTTASDLTLAVQKDYYNKYNQLIKTERTHNGITLASLYEYDYMGRVTKETDPNGNTMSYEYTYDGQISKQTDAVGNSVKTVYDLAGQKVSVTDANGNTTNTTYDKMGRVIKVKSPFNESANGEAKTYYDKNSNVVKTSVKRSANKYQTEEYKFDNMGHMLGYITKGSITPEVVQYQYDTAGRIIKMITGLSEYKPDSLNGNVTSYSYNSSGYLSKIVDPMGFTETYNNYDYVGNLLSMTDKNSNTIHNVYGAYGLEKTYFDNSPETKEYIYDNLGRLTNTKAINADEQSVEESYQYDAFGRLTTSTANDGSVQNYAYDGNSNLTSYELVKDEEVKNAVSYEYNALNRLTSLTSNDIITSYKYDNVGNLTQKAQNNGVTVNYTYNKAGMMTRTESKKGSNVYTYSDCEYILNGLMSKVTMPSDDGSIRVKDYSYDNMGRLSGEYMKDGSKLIENNS